MSEDTCVGKSVGWTTGCQSPTQSRVHVFSHRRSLWLPPILLLQWVPAFFHPWVCRPGRGADESPASSAEVKNEWSYTSIPSPDAFIAWKGEKIVTSLSSRRPTVWHVRYHVQGLPVVFSPNVKWAALKPTTHIYLISVLMNGATPSVPPCACKVLCYVILWCHLM
jgi:hypothetical protein